MLPMARVYGAVWFVRAVGALKELLCIAWLRLLRALGSLKALRSPQVTHRRLRALGAACDSYIHCECVGRGMWGCVR